MRKLTRRVLQRRALSVFLQGWQCAAGFRGGRHLLCTTAGFGLGQGALPCRVLVRVLGSTVDIAAGTVRHHPTADVTAAQCQSLFQRLVGAPYQHDLQPPAILVPERTVVHALSVRLVDILLPAPRPTRTAADSRAHPRRVQLLNISTRRCGGQGCRQDGHTRRCETGDEEGAQNLSHDAGRTALNAGIEEDWPALDDNLA